MNSDTIKMFGPSISDASKIVNRDVPACDELAYKAAGYKRGSVEVAEPEAVKANRFPTEEAPVVDEPVQPADKPKARKSKGQK